MKKIKITQIKSGIDRSAVLCPLILQRSPACAIARPVCPACDAVYGLHALLCVPQPETVFVVDGS